MSSDKSIDSVSSDPTLYSGKLNSLLNFLDEINDRSDDVTSVTGVREIRGVSSTKFPITCHADTTKYSARSTSQICENEKKVDEPIKSLSSNPHLIHEKKYIWDEWDEPRKDPIHQKKYIWDDDEIAKLDEETKCLWNDLEGAAEDVDEQKNAVPDKRSKRCPVDARHQLQLLKSMSEEIQTRADAMKIQLEQKTREVEELHSVRVKSEAEHVQKMISLKQEWKQRIDDVKAGYEKFMHDHDKLKDSLTKDCDTMEKQVTSFQVELERATTSEKEMCERLRADGTRTLEDARKMWQQAEKDELKKKDNKTSIKLKKDAAKAVESKLRQLIERNKEEIERMEREAERELEFYKLELYKRSNEEFRKETNKIRDDERSRMLNLENDWIAKMEITRRERENELMKVSEEFEQRADIFKRHLSTDTQRIADEHQVAVAEAQMEVEGEKERVRAQHEHEMAVLEEEYRVKMDKQQKSSEAEFKQWKSRRNSELLSDEEKKLKDEHERVKRKFLSDINLVKQKLAEEKAEKKDGGW